MEIGGVCTCGCDLWRWEIRGGEIILTCKKCKREARFGVMTPLLDIFADAIK